MVYNKSYEWRWIMTTSDMVRELCVKQNISLAELCRRIGQTPQNFNKKLKRGTVSFEEMMVIAEAMGVGYEQAFVLPDGEKIGIDLIWEREIE
jgi:transcriptional regulator with XRE-family HTH domain